jgi:hypothetical protein
MENLDLEKNFLDKSIKNTSETIHNEETAEIIEAIIKIKRSADVSPDQINIHLQNIPEPILRSALEDDDIKAYKKVFITGEWNENSEGLKNYEKKIVNWEKLAKQDSGISPKINARRQFSTMIRHYLIDKMVTEKLRLREEKKQQGVNTSN